MGTEEARVATSALERERRQVGPEVGPTSGFSSCIITGMHGPTGIFWANLTPFSLQRAAVRLAATRGDEAAAARRFQNQLCLAGDHEEDAGRGPGAVRAVRPLR